MDLVKSLLQRWRLRLVALRPLLQILPPDHDFNSSIQRLVLRSNVVEQGSFFAITDGSSIPGRMNAYSAINIWRTALARRSESAWL